ncbi:regulator of chromosome condensation 1/beta-lactamase-inhibitor protein II [Pelagophyceae sp. CCMP2097]|nr:regulator of chromosome condensation 1/beta-lactamase-inhibitor protein II [Pelagophyceae sp. CCMP2097]
MQVRPPAGTLLDCSSHALVASRAGAELYSCGRGRCGQRGVRNVFDSYELERLCHAPLRTADRPVVSVGCGVAFSVLAAGAGVAYGFGDGTRGAIGTACAPCLSCGTPRPIPELARYRVHVVAAGAAFALFVVNEDRKVVGMGANDDGQLGVGDRKQTRHARPVVDAEGRALDRVDSVAAGTNHALAVSNGGAYSWGAASRGKLGHFDRRARCHACRVVDGSLRDARVVKVAAGDATSIALDAEGVLHACGDARSGALGLGGSAGASVLCFRRVDALLHETVTDVAVGFAHAVATTAEGHVYTWGAVFKNHAGCLGRGTDDDDGSPVPMRARLPCTFDFAVAVAAGGAVGDPFVSSSLVALRDGSVLCCGGNKYLPGNDGYFAALYTAPADADEDDEEREGAIVEQSYSCYGIF